MKLQRIIHAASALAQIAAVLWAVYYLPPYLKVNPGVRMLVAVFIVTDLAHFIFHDR